jgi:glycine betaine/proline transport system substrate-binding protein
MANQKIVFADLSWDSIQFHNRVAGFIIEKGYGYPVEYLFVDITPGLMGLERGDVDIDMELWPTYNLEWWEKAQADGSVLNLGINFENATQGWYVPTYLIKGDPARNIEPLAPDLKRVADLEKYWELFRDPESPEKGRLINGPAGWVAHDINITKLEGYGLDRYFQAFSPGSGTALDTYIATSYERGRPVLFYYWEPTWLLGKYDMTLLEETPFDEKLWTPENKFACQWLSATTYIVAGKTFAERFPDVTSFLRNYRTSLEVNQKALAYMHETGATPDEAARWFLTHNPGMWKSWIPDTDIEVIGEIEKALQ